MRFAFWGDHLLDIVLCGLLEWLASIGLLFGELTFGLGDLSLEWLSSFGDLSLEWPSSLSLLS